MAELDHIAVGVDNLEEGIKLFTDLFGCKKGKIFEIDEPECKVKYTLLRTNGTYIELIELIGGKYAEDARRLGGEGRIFEMCFKVDDLKKTYNEMKAREITLVDINSNIVKEETFDKQATMPSGNLCLYIPRDKVGGMNIELRQIVTTGGE